jgi:hypothetical protein
MTADESSTMSPSESQLVKAPVNWAAMKGVWTLVGPEIVYEGPLEASPQPYGLTLSNLSMRDGRISVKISFDDLHPGGNSAAGIVLGFKAETAPYVVPQLGGYGYAYAIAESVPGSGWLGVAMAGSVRNLESKRLYGLEVLQRGQQITMAVDDVKVFEHTLAWPPPGNQVGLFAWGTAKVRFSDFGSGATKPRAFIAMQFGAPFDTLYREVIRDMAKRLGFEVVRLDEIGGPGIIFEDLKREIEQAKVLIAEITAPNQNVFYEVGYAHALNKPTILLAQRGKELPFDIRSYRVIFYEDTIGGKLAVERALEQHLKAVLNEL